MLNASDEPKSLTAEIDWTSGLSLNSTPERRRYQRIHLLQPVPGVAADRQVMLVDLSLCGVRVAHQEPIGRVGSECPVSFEWQGERADLQCVIARTSVQRIRKAGYATTIYHSGLRIDEYTPEVGAVLRDIVRVHVDRALDEQRANAMGIPPQAARSAQIGGSGDFIRHELEDGRWRQVPTSNPGQPPEGFTIDASSSEVEVAMLREAYERSASMRETIRKMAELSVSNPDGLPARRYEP